MGHGGHVSWLEALTALLPDSSVATGAVGREITPLLPLTVAGPHRVHTEFRWPIHGFL